MPRTLSEKPHRDLTPTQEEVADLASQIILNGGDRTEVIPFLEALYRYQHKNRSFYGPSDRMTQADLVELVESRATGVSEYAFVDLVRVWPKVIEKPTDDTPKPTTVKRIAQAELRDRLQDHFDQFLSDTSELEPIWLMNEILEWYVSDNVDLADTFTRVMSADATYVRVKRSQADKVRAFVELIKEKESD